MQTLKKIAFMTLVMHTCAFATYSIAFEYQGQAPASDEEGIKDIKRMGFHMGVVSACSNTINVHSNRATVRTFLEKLFAYHNKLGLSNKEIGKIIKENIKLGEDSVYKDRFFALCWRSAANIESAYQFFGLKDKNLNKIGNAIYPME